MDPSQKNWIPDSEALECQKCKKAFSFLLRRHHCRNCGGVFCGDDSSKRFVLKVSRGPERVCDGCYKQLHSHKTNSSLVTLKKQTRLLYETRSICVQCAINEHRGFKFAHVVGYVCQYGDNVYLFSICTYHPLVPQVTLLSTNATFYHYLTTFNMTMDYGPSIIDQFLSIPKHNVQLLHTAAKKRGVRPISTTASSYDATDVYSDISSLHTIPVDLIQYNPLPGSSSSTGSSSSSVGGQSDGQIDMATGKPLQSLHSSTQQQQQQQQQQNQQPQSPSSSGPQATYGLDSKELYRRLLLPHKTPNLLPLVIEINLTDPTGELRSDSDITSELYEIKHFYPPGYGFILKVIVGLVGSFTYDVDRVMIDVNDKLLAIDEWLTLYMNEHDTPSSSSTSAVVSSGLLSGAGGSSLVGNNQNTPFGGISQAYGYDPSSPIGPDGLPLHQPSSPSQPENPASSSSSSSSSSPSETTILVDVSVDRILSLAEVPNSIFLKGNVYPFLRYNLLQGDTTCINDISSALNKLSLFSYMHCCIMLIIESEGGVSLPNLKPVLDLLLSRSYIVRMILFNQQRNVDALLHRITDRYSLVSELYNTLRSVPDSAQQLQLQQQQQQQLQQQQYNGQNDISGSNNPNNQLQDPRQIASRSLIELNLDVQILNLMAHQTQASNNNTGGGNTSTQIRLSPNLLSSITYSWLQSRLFYYNRKLTPPTAQQQQQQQQQQQRQPPQPPVDLAQLGSNDTCMETVDLMPLINAINHAIDGNVPLASWFPACAVLPLAGLMAKKLRSPHILNFNPDPTSVIGTIIIHKQGYGISTSNTTTSTTGIAGGGNSNNPNGNSMTTPLSSSTNNTSSSHQMIPGTVSYSGDNGLLNVGQVFDLKKLFNSLEALSFISCPQHNPDGTTTITRQSKSWKQIISDGYTLTKLLNSAVVPGSPVTLTQLLSLTDSKESQARKAKATQVILIVNSMDIGCVDILRRCRPLTLIRNTETTAPIKFVSSDLEWL